MKEIISKNSSAIQLRCLALFREWIGFIVSVYCWCVYDEWGRGELQLAAEARYGDAQLFAILCYSSARYGYALLA